MFYLFDFYILNETMVFFIEMVTAMKTVASLDVELTVEERNLLSVAYKNVIGARRASWRIISSIEQKEENKAAEDKLKMIKAYRSQVQTISSFLLGLCVKACSESKLVPPNDCPQIPQSYFLELDTAF